jgi:WD40 repeat protein
MGEVYRARDTRLDRTVAIKILRSEVAADPDRLRLFEREAKAVASLNHPHILTVHDVGTEGDTPYVVTELLEGETLRTVLSGRSPTQRQVLSFAVQGAQGLAAAHHKGVIHRDLKPENLFVTTDGRVKILDFGLAKLTAPPGRPGAAASTAGASTPAGVLMGTVAYMSPEQVRALPLDQRSDIFSFGVVLHEVLGGQHPFKRETAPATLEAIVHETPPDLVSLGRGIPPALAGIVGRCLEKSREERFHSAHDLALALEAVLPAPSGSARLEEVEERSPYPGLRSFTEKDAGAFFGRETEVAALWERIRGDRLLAMIGPSGAGKTSFLRAGVISGRPEGWTAVVMTPGAQPFRALGRVLGPELAGDSEALGMLADAEEPDTAVELVGRWRRSDAEGLLVVDQYEELFTLNPPEVQGRFAALLGRLASEGDVHVLLSLRDDFLIRCCGQPPLASVLQNLTALQPLEPEALRRALEEPARKRGYRFEGEALLEAMVQAVEGARAALPLLAFTVSRLWEKRDRKERVLTRAAYEEIGGVAGALAQHAEQTLERIGSEREGTVREIFRNLVTAQGTRAVGERQELLSVFPERAAAEEVLRRLVDARLLTSYEAAEPELGARGKSERGASRERAVHRIEIVHESLLGAWPRLIRWRAQDEEGAVFRDQLKQVAHLWVEKGRPDDLLWTGNSEREFELWQARYPGTLTALEEDFAQAMVRRARRRKRLRRLVAGSVLAGAVLVAAVTGALWRRSEADRERARAEALRAEAGRLLALGRAELDRSPTAALAFVRRSLQLADTPEARRFVVEVLWRGPVARILSPDRVLGGPDQPENPGWSRPVFSPDARWLALDNEDLQQIVLVPSDGGPPRTVPRPQGNVHSLGFGRQSDVLVTGGSGASLQLWSLPDLREGRSVEVGGAGSVGYFRSGRLFTQTEMEQGDRHRLFRSWSLPRGEATILGTVDWDGITGASVDPAGRSFAYASGHAVHLLPFNDLRQNASRVLGRHRDAVYLVEFFPGGGGVASVDKAGEIRLWPLGPSASASPRVLRGPKASDRLLAVAGDGTHLARSGVAGSLHLWDLSDPPDAEAVVLKRTDVVYMTSGGFDPSGRWLVATNDLNVAFWPVTGHWRRLLPGYYSGTWRLAFTPDGRWLTSCTVGEAARLWPMSPASGEARAFAPEACYGLAIHPESTHVLVTTWPDGRAFLHRISGGPPVSLRTGWEGKVASLGAAFDARGRRAVTCSYETRDPSLRVLRVWDLETGEGRSFSLAPFTDVCRKLAFAPDGTVFVGGDGGVFRVVLPDDPNGTVSAETLYAAGRASFALSPDGRRLLVWAGRNPGAAVFDELVLLDPATHTSRRITTHGQRLWTAAFDPSGRIVVSADIDGVLRAGPVSGEEPHLLLGHSNNLTAVAVSPDARWIASVSDDGLSLWPMPDVTKPPLHMLPHAELMATLDALTNLRVVRDPTSSTDWKLDVGPFPGWKDVPTW